MYRLVLAGTKACIDMLLHTTTSFIIPEIHATEEGIDPTMSNQLPAVVVLDQSAVGNTWCNCGTGRAFIKTSVP